MVVDGEEITIREYPALSMEEAIITAIKAERDGASALVCAPIVATTVERIVSMPVSTIRPPTETLMEAIRRASKKSL
jgi:predicted transcriptional regulator